MLSPDVVGTGHAHTGPCHRQDAEVQGRYPPSPGHPPKGLTLVLREAPLATFHPHLLGLVYSKHAPKWDTCLCLLGSKNKLGESCCPHQLRVPWFVHPLLYFQLNTLLPLLPSAPTTPSSACSPLWEAGPESLVPLPITFLLGLWPPKLGAGLIWAN